MRTVIQGMLQEEKQRNLRMQKIHKKEMQSLRKGSIMRKSVGGHDYYYLKYRQGNKVKNDYIGKDEASIAEIRQ